MSARHIKQSQVIWKSTFEVSRKSELFFFAAILYSLESSSDFPSDNEATYASLVCAWTARCSTVFTQLHMCSATYIKQFKRVDHVREIWPERIQSTTNSLGPREEISLIWANTVEHLAVQAHTNEA